MDHQESSCSVCNGEDYIFTNGGVKPCECLINRRKEGYTRRLIPERYRGSRIANLEPSEKATVSIERQRKVIEILRSNPFNGYLFFGSTGVGKTHLLFTLANEAIQNNLHVITTSCIDLLRSARESDLGCGIAIVGRDELDRGEYCKPLHLFIDEFDKIKLTEFSQLYLFDIVNRAYDNPKKIKISITSNLPPNKFEENYGMAFYRKLKEISIPIIYGG